MKRREVLKMIGAAAGVAGASRFLQGCGEPQSEPGRISTYVFMMMENRSYDHVLGMRSMLEGKPGDGLSATHSNPDLAGQPVSVWPASEKSLCALDPPHGWDASRLQLASGLNDGFLRVHQKRHDGSALEAMQYLVRSQQPVTHALADAYTSCDRWFSSVLGPTQPNRMYWHAGTSGGAKGNGDVFNGSMRGLPNIFSRLDDANVDFTYYFGDVPVLALLDGDFTHRMKPFFPDFLEDAAAGRLPPVVYVDPAFSANDDHPPHHPMLGQQLIAATYQALATSPQWNETLFLLTYDENGGFYDHVAPPTVFDERAAEGFDQLGFRVPALIAGPYVRQGAVSSVVRDHTSALRHLENAFSLEPLNQRTLEAADLTDALDAGRLAAAEARPPVALPAVEVDEADLPPACKTFGAIAVHDHEMLEWAEANPGRLGALDRRRHVRDSVYGIAEYLDRQGLGRIRRGAARRFV